MNILREGGLERLPTTTSQLSGFGRESVLHFQDTLSKLGWTLIYPLRLVFNNHCIHRSFLWNREEA